jgi:hypothetical protein
MSALNAVRNCSACNCFTYMPPQRVLKVLEWFQENFNQTKPNQVKLVPTQHCIHITEFKIDRNYLSSKMHN